MDRATALTLATSNGHTETVRALLESGASLETNAQDEYGAGIESHVQVALLKGHVDTCLLLLQAMTHVEGVGTRSLDTDHTGADRPTAQS